MSETNKHLDQIYTPENSPIVLNYTGIVNAVQLSVARLMSLPGAVESQNFNELLNAYPSEQKQGLVAEVGSHFDQELIKLVTCSLIAARQKRLIIMAASTDGINGGLPWEGKLQDHITNLQNKGLIGNDKSVEITRYGNELSEADISLLTPADDESKIAA